MTKWLKAAWFPVVLTIFGPLILFGTLGSLLDFGNTASFFVVWPCYVGACAATLGWRVVRKHAGSPRSAALGSLVIVALGAWPMVTITQFVFSVPPPELFAGWLFVLVALVLCSLGVVFLGWVGATAATRIGQRRAS
jgi:hypothetical protein